MTKISAAEAFGRIEAKRRRPWKGEEEVRIAWVSSLEAATGLNFDAERSAKDSSYNHVIIEFKAPGLFKGSKNSPKFREATVARLLPYIQREAQKTDIPEEDFIGIAIDGEHICFAQVQAGVIKTQHLVPFSEYAVELVIWAVEADTRRAVTSANLLADFGHGSVAARALMQALADALATELAVVGNTKIKMLFEEWRDIYGQVADMSILQADAINNEISFTWNGNATQAMSGRLFVIHTYNSLLIKLLAAEIVSAHGLTASMHPAQAMMALKDDTDLLNTLYSDIERAALFSSAGIKGFVEEAIFSWYIDVARKPAHASALLSALRTVLAQLSLYRTDRLSRTRDVLRDVYQGLVPGKLRQSLGEYYTPDWLVDLTVDKAAKGPWLHRRTLDPTCGSGAFLLSLLRRIRAEALAEGWGAAQIVEHLCQSVCGFDLNPLAVQTARVNFLIEIADLLRAAPGLIIEVPVMLADAIYSPAPNPTGVESVINYQIGSQVAGLDITLPAALAFDRTRLDDIFARMGDEVEKEAPFKQVAARLVSSGLMLAEEARDWHKPLKHTYQQILDLHKRQWNGIWFRVVRNFFWSATAGHFDCIVGNPPWVRWSKLPELYRERVKPTCEHYGIFSATKYHGGNELDISAMITYATADKWLKVNGRLAFLITGAVFKNASSAGFRKFKIEPSNPSSAYLAPVSVDDMKALKPFEDAANHTTIAVFDKARKPGTFPVPYRVWDRSSGTRFIPPSLTLPQVLERVNIEGQEAVPVDGDGSPWAVLPQGRYDILKTMTGACTWTSGRKGITTDLNGVYFVQILQSNGTLVQIRSRPEAGKKNIGVSKTAWVEPTLLYPLLKGASDFEPCYLRLDSPDYREPRLFTFVPNRGIGRQAYRDSEDLMNTPALAKTRAWFRSYKPLLETRSTYRRQMQGSGAGYQAVYNVGDYTFQPWKVIWPEMSTNFYAAVASCADVPIVGRRSFIPDHKVYFAAFEDKEPAYFLCGLLNAPMVREWVESHTVSIQMGDVFKHMDLPKFDGTDAFHLKLATLVERAHAEHNAEKRAILVKKVYVAADSLLRRWAKARARSVHLRPTIHRV